HDRAMPALLEVFQQRPRASATRPRWAAHTEAASSTARWIHRRTRYGCRPLLAAGNPNPAAATPHENVGELAVATSLHPATLTAETTVVADRRRCLPSNFHRRRACSPRSFSVFSGLFNLRRRPNQQE